MGLVSSILLRFPGPVILRASRRKWITILLVCIAVVAVSMFLLEGGLLKTSYQKLMIWPGLVLFSLGIPLTIAVMLPGASQLELDAEGFEVTKFFRRHRVLWRDATGFEIYRVPTRGRRVTGLVVFDNAKQKNSILASMNVSLAGRNAYIPDTYGLTPEDLARLMTQWRERALR